MKNFIDAFLEYSAGIPSPEIFRKWAAIGAVSGALERRVYARTAQSPLYPNSFVLLVGAPGVGKSRAIDEIHYLLAQVGLFNLAPDSITKAGFIDRLAAGMRSDQLNGIPYISHSMLIASSEFGVLVPSHDIAFLNTLNKIYDCGSIFEEVTRSGGSIKLDHPHVSLLAGTQPKYLADLLPENAWHQGFTSRIIFVYSNERSTVPIFTGLVSKNRERERDLVAGLETIGHLRGEMTFVSAVVKAVEEWQMQGMEPVPMHPRLQHYNTRRMLHLLKLTMIHTAAEGLLKAEERHFKRAKDDLLEVEEQMPEIFREMSLDPAGVILDETYHFVFKEFMRNKKKPVSKQILINYLSRRVPANSLGFYISILEHSGRLRVVSGDTAATMYEPGTIETY